MIVTHILHKWQFFSLKIEAKKVWISHFDILCFNTAFVHLVIVALPNPTAPSSTCRCSSLFIKNFKGPPKGPSKDPQGPKGPSASFLPLQISCTTRVAAAAEEQKPSWWWVSDPVSKTKLRFAPLPEALHPPQQPWHPLLHYSWLVSILTQPYSLLTYLFRTIWTPASKRCSMQFVDLWSFEQQKSKRCDIHNQKYSGHL